MSLNSAGQWRSIISMQMVKQNTDHYYFFLFESTKERVWFLQSKFRSNIAFIACIVDSLVYFVKMWIKDKNIYNKPVRWKKSGLFK